MKKRLLLLLTFLLPAILLALFYQPAPAAPGPADADVWVVQIYFDDQTELQALADWREPWEVDVAAGFLLVEIRPVEYDILTAAGFRVEVDQARTETANLVAEPLPGQDGGTIPGYPCYRTVESTLDSGALLASTYPDLATWSDIGDSWEKVQASGEELTLLNPAGLGYDIMVLKLTNSNISGPKPQLFVSGGIHAREYTSAETAIRLAEYLLGNYGVDPDVTWLLDYHEIHIVPQTNPDGRKIAEAPDIWHRKNTNDDACSALVNPGIDLNRNFPFLWGYNSGSSSSGCDDTYRGSGPVSEPEALAIVDYVRSTFPDQRPNDLTIPAPITTTGIFIDLHSYSNVILWPWGPPSADIGSNISPNQLGYNALARRMGFINGYAASKTLSYSVSGTTKDFAYGELGIAAFTMEMGTEFHQSCSVFENSMIADNLATLIYAAKASRQPYALPFGPDMVELEFVGPTLVGEPALLQARADDGRYGAGHANNPSGQVLSQPVVAAYYYVDLPPWEAGAVAQPMAAADGSFSSSSEVVTATIDTSGLAPGRHIIYLQAEDFDGDRGVVSAIFLDLVDGENIYLPTIVQP